MAEGETIAGGDSSEEAASSLVATMAADDPVAPRRRPRRYNTAPEKGSTVGRYVVVSRLGAGAMGVVMAAYDPQLDRKVAIKLLRSRYRNSVIDRTRLQREAQALARLSHPNVVAVHDVGVHEERVFVAMEFVAGRNLRQWLDETGGRRPWPEVVEVFEAAGRGLAAAHAESLVHRDFKPENVMIGDDGRVRVMDFGLVRATTTPSSEREGSGEPRRPRTGSRDIEDSAGDSLEISLTQVGALMGTPAYMAPEQFMGAEVDERCDQFAFCVSLYEALYGERPFEGDSVPALAEATMSGVRKAVPRGVDVPGWLRRIVLRGLTPEPDGRYGSMAELLGELGALEAQRRRRRWAVGVAAVGAAGLSLWGVYRYDQARRVAACEQQGQAIDEVWNEPAREGVRAGLVATELDYAPAVAERVMPWLDRYADDWREHTTEACMQAEVREAWDAATLDKSQWCLEEDRRFFESLIGKLRRADAAAVQNAVRHAAELRPSITCIDERSLFAQVAPPREDARAEVWEARARLGKAEQMVLAGEHEEGQQIIDSVLQQVEASGWLPLRIHALKIQVMSSLAQARYPEAETRAIEVYMEAVRADAWDMATTMAVELVEITGVRQARSSDGELWARHAEVAAAKGGDPLGRLEASRANKLGSVLFTEGDYEQARLHYERALTLWQDAFGLDHPNVAVAVSNIGNVYHRLGQNERARTFYEQALDIRVRMLGSGHPEVAESMINLGVNTASLDDHEKAKELYRRALIIIENTRGPDHLYVAAVSNNLALIHLELEEHEQARPLYERAIEIKERALGPEHPNLLYSISGLGHVLVGLGEHGAAIPMLERALTLKAPQRTAEDEAQMQLSLVEALWGAPPAGGRDRVRAHALAKDVAGRPADDLAEERGKAEAWLAEHPMPAPSGDEPP